MAPWIKKLSVGPLEFKVLQYLFHGTPESTKTYRKSITPHLLNAAKKIIQKYWKQAQGPTITEWRNEVNLIMEAERWVHVVKDQQKKFEKTWAGWGNCVMEMEKERNIAV